ncbi:MAG: gamma-glutamyl-gamma-aminobutyrate hydrolase family protein [Gammaproteobacteria bacterium]
MKTIAITQRITHEEAYSETRDALDQRWWKLLNVCNLTPLIFPNDLTLAYKLLQQIPIDGVILTGGNQTRERLEVESLLLEEAIAKDLPVLGVCNGMQIIQNYFGVTLQKIPNHVIANQEIIIDEQPAVVNSYHEYGTTQTNEKLVVWAKAHDGVVKAIRHTEYPIIGIMWHPERLAPFAERDLKLLQKLFLEL